MQDSPEKKIRIAIVGLGKIGLSHFSMINVRPDTQAPARYSAGLLVDVFAKYLPDTRIYTRYEDLLEKGNLDAVVIATPSRLHVPMVRVALERGLHAFCKKPFLSGLV